MTYHSNMKVNINLINCNQGELDGPLKILNKLYLEFEVKHPNAWHIMLKGKSKWDGKVHYITEYGKFRIGLLPMIYKRLIELGCEVNIRDMRPEIGIRPILPKMVGKLTPRPEQRQVLSAIINNEVGGCPFYIGVQNLSVNFGKTLIMAGLYLAFKKGLKTLLLTQDGDWLDQAREEFKDLLPEENITFVQGAKVVNWGNFSIGMVQSISRNIKVYQKELSTIQMLLIDEGDLIDNKTYKAVIEHLWFTPVRLIFSGSIYMSKLKKDLVHNMNVRSFAGDELTIIALKEMIDKGYSTNVIVKLVPTTYNVDKFPFKNYPLEYETVISKNRQAYRVSLIRTSFNLKMGRTPMLIVTKFIEHCESLYNYYKQNLSVLEKAAGRKLIVSAVHHDTKDRKHIIKEFREGRIDILISNTFIARGKNFPLLRYLQNTASMDSNEKTLQLLGRLVRTSKGKIITHLDDIQFNGKYLTKHGNHRKKYYLKENLKVIKLKRLTPSSTI